MRILFYEDPLTDQSSYIWRAPHIVKDANWVKALLADGADVRILCHSDFAQIALNNGIGLQNILTIKEELMRDLLLYPQQNINSDFQRYYNEIIDNQVKAGPYQKLIKSVSNKFADAIKKITNDFIPDVIITWVPAPHLREIFPDALILHKETGMLNRKPYPLIYYLDPFGYLNNSALRNDGIVKKNNHIDAVSIVASIKEFVGYEFENSLLEVDRLFNQTINFKERVLLANHTSGVFFFDAISNYRSQAHAVIDVLENIPPDTALIVSEHPDCQKLRADEIELIKSKYPNFFCWPQLNEISGSGQKLVTLVDKVVTVSSSIGLQALLWGKPLISLGNSQINDFCAGVGAQSIENAQDNNFDDETAAWVIFNYSVFDELCKRPNYLLRHLSNLLAKWRKGEIGNLFNGFDNIAKFAQNIIKDQLSINYEAKFLEKFSGGEIDFFDESKFGKGWNNAEDQNGLKYRWMKEKTAVLKLILNKIRHNFKLTAGTHFNCNIDQLVTVEIDGNIIASETVNTLKPADIDIIISPDLIGEKETQIIIKATRLEKPDESLEALSLIISGLSINPIFDELGDTNKNITNIGKKRLENPRHSILIPTLNGGETLKTILPTLLDIIPDDCELVISDNCSVDDTWDVINSYKDQRLSVFRQEQQIDYGNNADACYANSRGGWLSHIGDDDLVNHNRFSIIDKVSQNDEIEMIFGSRLRYYWSEFPDVKLANVLDAAAFDENVIIDDGAAVFARLINSINIRHTGAVAIKRSLLERVRYHNNGTFMQKRLGEYCSYRIAAGFANNVAFVNQPLAIIGRHSKSIGTAMHHNERFGKKYQVDTEREIGSIHHGTGFNFKGQTPFSFEASLRAYEVHEQFGMTPKIDYVKWFKHCLSELTSRKVRGIISAEYAIQIEEEARRFWDSKYNFDNMETNFQAGCPILKGAKLGWQTPIYCEQIGISNIEEIAEWFKNNNPVSDNLNFYNLNDINIEEIEWVDG